MVYIIEIDKGTRDREYMALANEEAFFRSDFP